MNLYEIVIESDPYEGHAEYYASTIVATDTEAPAGTVPADVMRHADMLRRIVGSHATMCIGWHELKNTSKPGSASTVWLYGPNRGRTTAA